MEEPWHSEREWSGLVSASRLHLALALPPGSGVASGRAELLLDAWLEE